MIKIAICDDDLNNIIYLRDILNEHIKTKNSIFEISINTYTNGLDLIDSLRSINYNLIFLDIIMPLINGIDVAHEIRKYNKMTKIVFLSSSPDFALESYDVRAFSYILKGSSPEKITAILDELILENETSANSFFITKTKNGITKIYYNTIEYVEVNGKTVTIYLINQEHHQLFSTLSEVESSLLFLENFCKVHRSYLVNLDYVKKIHEKELQTINNNNIPISKNHYSSVKKEYLSYSFK